MFNDIGWTKKGDAETCLHNAKEVAARQRPNSSQVSGASWGPRPRDGTEIPTNLKENALQRLTYSSVLLTYQLIFPATEPSSLGQPKKGGSTHHFQVT